MNELQKPGEEIVFSIDYREILLSLLHEAHVICNTLNNCSEILSRAASGEKIDKEAIKDHAYKIVENGYLLSLLLNRAEFEIDPSSFEKQLMLPNASLHGVFWKAIVNLKRIARSKRINILYGGKSTARIRLYPIIDLLPYIILDNALKYSPKNSNVNTQFIETPGHVIVSVRSTGPTLLPEEASHLFEKGFRGHEATLMVKQGSGRGLAIAKQICNIHNASIRIETGNEDMLFDGIHHSTFKVIMEFPRN